MLAFSSIALLDRSLMARSPRILLLAPDTASAATIYNRRMVAALAATGQDAELVPLAGCYPRGIADPRDVALIAALAEDAILVLDGLAMSLQVAVPRIMIGLVHHPSPLRGGTDCTDRLQCAELQALRLVIATSEAVAVRLAQQYGVSQERIVVVAPGVDLLARSPFRQSGPCHVLSVGALVARRSHDVLLRALSRLFDLDWRLTLTGSQTRDSQYVAFLQQLIDDLHLAARVTLLPHDAEVPWDSADLLVLANPVPSTTSAMFQALRRGIPLALCTEDVSLCPAGAGTLCPPREPEILSRALRRLIFDTCLRRDMADAAWRAGLALPGWEHQAERLALAVQGHHDGVYSDGNDA